MPVIDVDGCPLRVEVEGRQDAPVLMLSNSLGTNSHLWDEQAPLWSKHFRLVRYDQRGHGLSGFVAGQQTMERFACDALAIMDRLAVDKAHWCGLSMGGMVGQWLAAHAPERIDRLVLSNTSAYFPDKTRWNERIGAVRDRGLTSVADAVMAIWFTQEFRRRAPQTVGRMRDMLVGSPVDGYIAACEAIRDMDHRDLLGLIQAPTLVIAGRQDQSTPVESAEFMHRRIAGSKLVVLDTAHIANVEMPEAYSTEVLSFLTQRQP